MADRADAIHPANLLRRRFRRLRRFAILSLLLLLGAIALRIEWGRIAEHRVESFLADAKSRREPVSLQDLKGEFVPDDRNGSLLIFQAAQETVVDHNGYEFLRLVSAPQFPVTGQNLLIWNKLLNDNQHAIQMVRRAQMMPAFGSIESSGRNPATEFSHAIVLAELLERMACIASSEGRESDAIDDALDILAIGRAVRMQPGSQDSFRVSTEMIDVHAFGGISRLLSYPAVESASHENESRKLVTELSEEKSECFAFKQSCYFYGIQRISQRGFGDGFVFEHPFLARWLEPASRLDALRDANTNFDLAASTKERPIQYDAIRAQLHHRKFGDGPGVRRLLDEEEWGDASVGRLGSFCSYLTQRRMARCGLALRLYISDHEGRAPPTFDSLVPDYISSVPLDPFGRDGKKIGAIFWNNPAIWKSTVELTSHDRNIHLYVLLPNAVDQDSDVSVNQGNDDKSKK